MYRRQRGRPFVYLTRNSKSPVHSKFQSRNMSCKSPTRELMCSAVLVPPQCGGHRPRLQAGGPGWGRCQDTRSGSHSARFCCQTEFHKGEVVMAGGGWSCVLPGFVHRESLLRWWWWWGAACVFSLEPPALGRWERQERWQGRWWFAHLGQPPPRRASDLRGRGRAQGEQGLGKWGWGQSKVPGGCCQED